MADDSSSKAVVADSVVEWRADWRAAASMDEPDERRTLDASVENRGGGGSRGYVCVFVCVCSECWVG